MIAPSAPPSILPVAPQPLIVLGLPTANGFRLNTDAILQACQSGLRLVLSEPRISLLSASFNACWTEALTLRRTQGATHFLLLHADVVPQSSTWLTDLLQEMEAVGADVLSAVIALKSFEGLTSTALETDNPWGPQVLSVKALDCRPRTWTDPALLVNSGCLLVRLGAWAESIWFTITDRLRQEDQTFIWESAPEDWNFSRAVKAAGRSVYVTRAVAMVHRGDIGFHSHGHLVL